MFYMVFRNYLNPTKGNSLEIFNVSDYNSGEECFRAAEARFHNIITADLQAQGVVWQCTFIMDSNGNMIEKPVVFDRRTLNA